MKGRGRKLAGGLCIQALGLAVGLVIIFPVVYGILGAFKSPAEFSSYPPTLLPRSFIYLQNFRDAMKRVPFVRYALNSLVVATLGASLRLCFAALAAYACAFYDFPLKKTVFYALLGTMMLPADTLLITNYLTITKLGLLDSYLGMAITSLVGASQMFMLRQNFMSFPVSLREAAEMDGCSSLRFLFAILLPVAKPVLVTLLVQSFVTLWNAYLWPLLVTNKDSMRTVQVGITMITSFEETNYYLVLAGVTLTLIPSFVLFVVLRRNITRGMTAGALVG